MLIGWLDEGSRAFHPLWWHDEPAALLSQ
ncbi:hypothetical protein B14911_05349 [Bacillus sp. NRRL B-14911]|nr:hypothetical protein B14911_05349 [Bacillus sp. NRRL B-14911]